MYKFIQKSDHLAYGPYQIVKVHTRDKWYLRVKREGLMVFFNPSGGVFPVELAIQLKREDPKFYQCCLRLVTSDDRAYELSRKLRVLSRVLKDSLNN